MACASLQCQNERVQVRKLLDKQKKSALVCVAFEQLFDRQFSDYTSEVRRHKRMTLATMESKFQQHCLNNEEDPDVSDSMQSEEVDQYLETKQKVVRIFNDILKICSDVLKAEVSVGSQAEPVDFDPLQLDTPCMFCLNKEIIAEREMANHMSYLKEINRSATLTSVNEDRLSATQFDLPVTAGVFQNNILEDSASKLQSTNLDPKTTANAFSQQSFVNSFGSLHPANTDAALFSLPMIAETLAASLLELGLQQQQIDPRHLYGEFAMNFPFYSMPGYSDLPKNLSKNLVSQFFDAALAAQNTSNPNPTELSTSGNSQEQESPMDTSEPEKPCVSNCLNESSKFKADSDDEKSINSASNVGSSNVDDSNTPIKRTYSSIDLQQALRDVCDGKMGTRRASLAYGVPRSTIRNHLNKIKNYGKDVAFRMLDSETSTGDSIGDLLTLRGKQMISELRYVEDQKAGSRNGGDSGSAIPLMDKNQNISERFIKHSLAGYLEDYLSHQNFMTDVLAQNGEEVAALTTYPEKMSNAYLGDSDAQYVTNLRCALTAVQSFGMSVSKASAIFNIHTSNISDALALFA